MVWLQLPLTSLLGLVTGNTSEKKKKKKQKAPGVGDWQSSPQHTSWQVSWQVSILLFSLQMKKHAVHRCVGYANACIFMLILKGSCKLWKSDIMQTCSISRSLPTAVRQWPLITNVDFLEQSLFWQPENAGFCHRFNHQNKYRLIN